MTAFRIAAALALSLGTAGAALADDIGGTWASGDGAARIRIGPCGQARCATIVWTRAPAQDRNNPAPALRERSLVGVQLVSAAHPDGDHWSGDLYNPRDGKTYSGRMQVRGGELELSGCVLGGLICRSETWSRLR